MATKPKQTTLVLMNIELILIIAAVFVMTLVVICYALQNRTTHEVALMMGSMLGFAGLTLALVGLAAIVRFHKDATAEYLVASGLVMLIFSMTLVPPGNWWGRIPIGILYVTPFAIGLGSRFGVKGSEPRLALAVWLALMGCIVTIALFVRDGLQAEDVAAGVIGILVGTCFLKKPAKKPPAKKKPKDAAAAPASGPAQPAPGPGPS